MDKREKQLALEMIDKCIWWAKNRRDTPDYDESYRQCAKDILVHLEAGRNRVVRGEPFDSITPVTD